MARSKHKRKVTGRQHLPFQKRARRLARHLTWHGKRLANDSDSHFHGGIRFNRLFMTDHDAQRASAWALESPQRWWIRATAYCRTEAGDDYRVDIEAETDQAQLADELAAWRRQLLEQAKAQCNPRHLVAEGYETGVL